MLKQKKINKKILIIKRKKFNYKKKVFSINLILDEKKNIKFLDEI